MVICIRKQYTKSTTSHLLEEVQYQDDDGDADDDAIADADANRNDDDNDHCGGLFYPHLQDIFSSDRSSLR